MFQTKIFQWQCFSKNLRAVRVVEKAVYKMALDKDHYIHKIGLVSIGFAGVEKNRIELE